MHLDWAIHIHHATGAFANVLMANEKKKTSSFLVPEVPVLLVGKRNCAFQAER